MKNAIIIHGKPSKENYYSTEHSSSSNFAWIPWLQKQLIVKDIKTDTPEMPHAYRPEYSAWKREFERFDITPETILIGHSIGAGFLVRWLSENNEQKVDQLILIAPSLDPLRKVDTGFGEFEIDPEIPRRVRKFVVMTSDNDSEAATMSLKLLTDSIEGIDVRMFSGYGHFIPEHMGKETIEEAVDILFE